MISCDSSKYILKVNRHTQICINQFFKEMNGHVLLISIYILLVPSYHIVEPATFHILLSKELYAKDNLTYVSDQINIIESSIQMNLKMSAHLF